MKRKRFQSGRDMRIGVTSTMQMARQALSYLYIFLVSSRKQGPSGLVKGQMK